jgi:hypothetical protein
MQRKNRILVKPAFAMILAVAIIILISGVMLLSLNISSQTSKRTIDTYLYEQAELHAKGAIEYALYEIARTGCLDTNLPITALDGIYDINISTRYSYTGETGVNTTTVNVDGDQCPNYTPNNAVTANEQNGSVLMDVTVTIPASVTGTEPVRFFRRTIQKL